MMKLKDSMMAMLLVSAVGCSSSDGDAIDLHGKVDVPPVVVDYGHGDGDSPDQGPPPKKCVINDNCPDSKPKCDTSKGICVECLGHEDCVGSFCVGGECKPYLCEPNAVSCVNNQVKTCSGDGFSYISELDCGDLFCFEGGCLACIPGTVECTPAENKVRMCRADGSGWDTVDDCGTEKKCIDGTCMNCIPLTKKCVGTEVHRCGEFGEAWSFLEDCDTENTGKLCHMGTCVELCKFNEKFKTNLGCEYWAIDMDQYDDGDWLDLGADAPFAVVISNTNKSYNATVVVSKSTNFVTQVKAPPNQSTIINLDPYNIVGTTKQKKAFRIVSNLPIVAYQFNPLENAEVYSNDASLLLPTNALGKKYMVLAWPTIGQNIAFQDLASNFAVVGVEEEPTPVTIKVSAATKGGGGVPALSKGQTWETTLERFEVLNIEAGEKFDDLTGSLISADSRVAVFAGHVCANIPVSTCASGKCSYDPGEYCSVSDDCPSISACDHMEEQLPPLSAWGDRYVVSKTWQRGEAPDIVRVLAAEDDTHVTLSPPMTSVPVLQSSQYYEFEIMDHVEITADKQILVGQYLEGQNAPGAAHSGCWNDWNGLPCEKSGGGLFDCSCDGNLNSCQKQSDCSPQDANIGDPAFIIAVPVQQFREEYVFLVPIKYENSYLNIIAEWGASITLDGIPIQAGQFTSLPSQDYVVARMPLVEGSHSLSSTKKVGIVVYGWDWYVSYGYPGGMKTETLKVWQ